MSNWPSAKLQVNGHEIHYYRSGGDKPPLILLHGFSDNGLCWIRAAQILEKDYDLIMPDAHGHGRSYRATPGQPLNLAADVAGLIQALGLAKPALLGHSMGASTAAAVAAEYPELVGVILLEDPPWFDEMPPTDKEEDSDEAANRWQWLLDLWDKSEAEIAATGQAQNPSWAEIEFGPWAASKLQLDRNILKSLFHPAPWPEVVPRITCPTLLIIADPERGGLVTPHTAQQIAQGWPLVQVTRINGAGHSIRREQFETFIEATTKFLRENYRG
jgi:pimeloyl-ACP methyl ester carboxylesterase